MSVIVRIPTPLQRLTQGKEEVEGATGTIMELISDLDKKFPGIAERITENGKVRRFVNIYERRGYQVSRYGGDRDKRRR